MLAVDSMVTMFDTRPYMYIAPSYSQPYAFNAQPLRYMYLVMFTNPCLSIYQT